MNLSVMGCLERIICKFCSIKALNVFIPPETWVRCARFAPSCKCEFYWNETHCLWISTTRDEINHSFPNQIWSRNYQIWVKNDLFWGVQEWLKVKLIIHGVSAVCNEHWELFTRVRSSRLTEHMSESTVRSRMDQAWDIFQASRAALCSAENQSPPG